MKRYKDKDDLEIVEYDSVGQFITDINSKPHNVFFKNRNESHGGDASWYGTKSYDEAMKLISNGWKDASKKMANKVKMDISVGGVVKTSRPVYSVVGSQASVPRYLQGIPTNMISRQITYSKQKVVIINKGISYSCSWKPEQIIDESIKALQIVQSMETSGQRVKLNVLWSVSNDAYHTVCKVCVKQPDERLNISKMAFPLAHPSMLRRFFFQWLETETFVSHDMGYFYGRPSNISIKNRAMNDNEYYIPEKIEDMDALIKQLQSQNPRKAL